MWYTSAGWRLVLNQEPLGQMSVQQCCHLPISMNDAVARLCNTCVSWVRWCSCCLGFPSEYELWHCEVNKLTSGLSFNGDMNGGGEKIDIQIPFHLCFSQCISLFGCVASGFNTHVVNKLVFCPFACVFLSSSSLSSLSHRRYVAGTSKHQTQMSKAKDALQKTFIWDILCVYPCTKESQPYFFFVVHFQQQATL